MCTSDDPAAIADLRFPPHLLKTRVSTLAVLLNYKLDESYTPRQLAVRGGTSYTDLKEIRTVEVNEPQGWVVIPLGSEEDPR